MVDEKNHVNAVESAARILCTFTPQEPSFGVRELARKLDISRTSVQRILISLRRADFLFYDPESERYSIGSGLLRMARPFMQVDDLFEVAKPVMESLREEFNETVTLSVIIAQTRVTIFQLPSRQELQYETEVGRQYPLLSGSTGRVLLTYLPQNLLDDTLDSLLAEPATWEGARRWGTDRPSLVAELASVRDSGYATRLGEWTVDGAGISVPIRQGDTFIAALSLYGPATRLSEAQVQAILPSLVTAALEIADHSRLNAPTSHAAKLSGAGSRPEVLSAQVTAGAHRTSEISATS